MTAPRKPAGRTLAEFQPLKPAEQKLLEACRQGVEAHISEKRPEAATDNNTVRAGFLRFLALDGDEEAPVHEHGIMVQGAWVEGILNLMGASVPHNLALCKCHFSEIPFLRRSHIRGHFSLRGSHVNGLQADGMICEGNVSLGKDSTVPVGKGFSASGEIRLMDAQISGSLEFNGATLDGKQGDALTFGRAVIKGGVFLNEGFTANGTVSLVGALELVTAWIVAVLV